MQDYKNILLINFGGIGDEILFLPVIDGIKNKFKDAKITLALEPRSSSIVQLTKNIDDTIKTDIKASGIKKYFNLLSFILSARFKKFDLIISSGKSPVIAIIMKLIGAKKRIGYKSKTSFLNTDSILLNENQYAGKMYYDLVQNLVNEDYSDPKIDVDKDYKLENSLVENNFIAIHPGVSKMSILKGIFKTPDIIFWDNLILELLNKGKIVALFGTKDDSDLIDEILKNENILNHKNFINYYNKTKNLLELANIFSQSEANIVADSAPLHISVGVHAKTFAIFGPTNEHKLIPVSDKFIVIKNQDVPCRPCLWHNRAQNCTHSQCLKIDYKQITDMI